MNTLSAERIKSKLPVKTPYLFGRENNTNNRPVPLSASSDSGTAFYNSKQISINIMKNKVLETMKAAGTPLNAGKIAALGDEGDAFTKR